MRILLVEDDLSLGHSTQEGLKLKGYIVDWVKDGAQASQVLKTEKFDVVILDLGLPKIGGYEILQQMRSRGTTTPVLILTANDLIEHCVKGLDLGADDYMTKPFDLNELNARVCALHRRATSRTQPMITHGDIVLDPLAHAVTYQGNPIDVPRREFLLLQKLLENPGKVLSRDYLTQMIYGFAEDADSNTLEVFIHHLRKKLGNDFIKTIRGIGYMVQKEKSLPPHETID